MMWTTARLDSHIVDDSTPALLPLDLPPNPTAPGDHLRHRRPDMATRAHARPVKAS